MADELLKQINEWEPIKKARNDFNNEMYKKTHQYQKQYGFEWNTGDGPTHNNESDAFKHAFMQSVLYYRASKKMPIGKEVSGQTYSKAIGDFHEWETRNGDKTENNMDLWNNEVGREVAKDVIKKLGNSAYTLPEESVENFFAKEITDRMKKGDLITRPSDPRKFEDRYKYTQTIKDAKKSYISNSKGQYNWGKKGRWVTVNGHHIFIEDEK